MQHAGPTEQAGKQSPYVNFGASFLLLNRFSFSFLIFWFLDYFLYGEKQTSRHNTSLDF